MSSRAVLVLSSNVVGVGEEAVSLPDWWGADSQDHLKGNTKRYVRRDRDSNPGPWHCCRAAVFKTTSIGHSDTPPCVGIVEGLRL